MHAYYACCCQKQDAYIYIICVCTNSVLETFISEMTISFAYILQVHVVRARTLQSFKKKNVARGAPWQPPPGYLRGHCLISRLDALKHSDRFRVAGPLVGMPTQSQAQVRPSNNVEGRTCGHAKHHMRRCARDLTSLIQPRRLSRRRRRTRRR